jgi:hypothetical protein
VQRISGNFQALFATWLAERRMLKDAGWVTGKLHCPRYAARLRLTPGKVAESAGQLAIKSYSFTSFYFCLLSLE